MHKKSTDHYIDFRSDTEAELALIREEALSAGADAAVVSNHWEKGGAGARNLAEAVITICEGESNFKFLYDLDLSIEEKISVIGKEIYGADGIELSELAQQQVDTYTRQGYSGLPSKNFLWISLIAHNPLVCMAKTQYSFSHDPKLKNVPSGKRFAYGSLQSQPLKVFFSGFKLPIRAVRLSAGAGFLYPILGDMQTMPGLGTRPGIYPSCKCLAIIQAHHFCRLLGGWTRQGDW